MPELPEVETTVRDLQRRVIGRRITAVEADFPGIVAYPDFPELAQRVEGQEITRVWRRGKYAVLSLASGDALIVHRGMSGSLLARRADDPPDRFVRLLVRLDDGTELRYDDPRKFGNIFVMAEDGSERALPWARMGPEPLDDAFTPEAFESALAGRTALIKPLLLGQQIVAGLGNIYVDEALYAAGIHPRRRAHSLSPEERARLQGAIRDVLRQAVERRGTTFSSYRDLEGRAGGYQDSLQVFRRAGAACPRCGDAIIRLVVGGRGTHICPTCQKE